MFIGHYGVALAARRWTPPGSLGWLFVAVQALDFLFDGFVLAGVEVVRIVPGFTPMNPYDLVFMPYSHSLVAAAAWSALAGLLVGALMRRRGREAAVPALVAALCVFSHWVLDAVAHVPDLPLLGGDSPKVGLGLWRHLGLGLAAELVVFAVGAAVWLAATGGFRRAPGATVGFLAALAAVAILAPLVPPSGVTEFAVMALASYLALAGAAALVDRARSR